MNNATACTVWQPTEKQRVVLAAFQEKGYDCTIEEACEAAGVSRRAYYYWHDDPAFSAWWADQSNRCFRLELHRVHAATLRAATEADAPGSIADRRLFYQRFDRDYCPQSRSKQEHSGGVGLGLDFSGMSDDELERYCHATDDDPPITSALATEPAPKA